MAQGREDPYDERFSTATRAYQDFLEADYGESAYKQKLRKMMDDKLGRLVVDLNDLRNYSKERGSEDLADNLVKNPLDYLPPFEEALKNCVGNEDASYKKNHPHVDLRIGVRGSFGSNLVSPRYLLAKHLNQMVCIEGIVTKCSLVRPKLVTSVHYCPATKQTSSREYRDLTHIGAGAPTNSSYPTKDGDGNRLETEYGLCTYRDNQVIAVQEMPERTPTGQLPRSVDIILESDLVDQCKPGDRVQIVGIYKSMPLKANGSTNGVFRTMMIGNNVRVLKKEVLQRPVTNVDIENIRKIAFDPREEMKRRSSRRARQTQDDMSTMDDFNRLSPIEKKDRVAALFDLLSDSFAPSIKGHKEIKKALLLLLVGGLEKNLPNGTHLRGDINVLVVGDPSTAKSQLLRHVLHVAPLAINTTGRGSTGVGLTAAVTQDRDTGDRRLEAGAMVLADRGVVCIDEFDKMNDVDRVAIHEVMEQQTVTIAKAGVHASLNARCSVLAAANPAYGKYKKERNVAQNLAMPDSLLSRFDLVFVVLDTVNPENDGRIAEHVLRMHRYRPDGVELGVPAADKERDDDTDDEAEADESRRGVAAVWEKNKLHSRAGGPAEGEADGQQEQPAKSRVLSMAFLKKYLQYAKSQYKPTMTDKACDKIAESYAELRSNQRNLALAVTARSLETMIRLATAHAKLRLSRTVEEMDAEEAIALTHESFVNEIVNAKKGAGEQAEGEAEKRAQARREADEQRNAALKKARRERRARERAEGRDVSDDSSGEEHDDVARDGNYDPAEERRRTPRSASKRKTTVGRSPLSSARKAAKKSRKERPSAAVLSDGEPSEGSQSDSEGGGIVDETPQKRSREQAEEEEEEAAEELPLDPARAEFLKKAMVDWFVAERKDDADFISVLAMLRELTAPLGMRPFTMAEIKRMVALPELGEAFMLDLNVDPPRIYKTLV